MADGYIPVQGLAPEKNLETRTFNNDDAVPVDRELVVGLSDLQIKMQGHVEASG